MRTRNFLLCVILTGFSLTAFSRGIGALNLLTNFPVEIVKQNRISKQIVNSLKATCQINVGTNVGAVYKISSNKIIHL